MSSVTLRVADSIDELNLTAAESLTRRAHMAVEARGGCVIALSGGSTPRSLYSLLAQPPYAARLAWRKLYFFWGDERCVPPDHADSNYHMARESLLAHVPIPSSNIFRVATEAGAPDAVARSYEATLRSFFGSPAGAVPEFDLILLGMGPDGHTASIFPDSPALAETGRLVAPAYAEHLKSHRVTFTLPLINQARCVMFLVAGADKAAALAAVLAGDLSYPAARVKPSQGDLCWLVGRSARSP